MCALYTQEVTAVCIHIYVGMHGEGPGKMFCEQRFDDPGQKKCGKLATLY